MENRYQVAARDYLDKLRTAAADRPAHAKYLAELEQAAKGKAATAATEAMADVPLPTGVSGRVAETLLDDMFWIVVAAENDDPKAQMSGFPHEYRDRRQKDAQGANERRRTSGRLENLLRFGGNE